MTQPGRYQAWEDRYTEATVWTGEVNAHLKEWATSRTPTAPSTAFDLACGEGADAMWLASRGWRVTAIDFATAAIDRAIAASARWGSEVTWLVADLTTWKASQSADLVSVSFLHESARVRHAVWHAAAQAVAPGGTLLIAGHAPGEEGSAGPPPDTRFTSREVVEVLGPSWCAQTHQVRRAGTGRHAGHVMTDLIITLTRPSLPAPPRVDSRC